VVASHRQGIGVDAADDVLVLREDTYKSTGIDVV